MSCDCLTGIPVHSRVQEVSMSEDWLTLTLIRLSVSEMLVPDDYCTALGMEGGEEYS